MRYRTYTLRIETNGAALDDGEQEDLSAGIQHAEDVINDRLPEGFYCKIDESGEGVDLAAVRRLEEMGQ
jgi:hypothetical protein